MTLPECSPVTSSAASSFSLPLGDRFVDEGSVRDVELRELKAPLGQHLADDDTVVFSRLLVEAWSREGF